MKNTASIIFRSLILLLIGFSLGLLISGGGTFNHPLGLSFSQSDKVSKILQIVRNNYVDSVNIDSIEGESINTVLQNLDPHSAYLPPQQAQSINERLEGGFNGIGIEYQVLRDTLYVLQVYPDGPAAKSGVVNGDRIVTIDDQPFSGTKLTTASISKHFRGEKDSELTLGILSGQSTKLKTYVIKRGHVDLSSLDAAYMAAPQTGYIKISKFAATTDPDFRGALKKLRTQGMQRLILDIRGNGGGYLSAATAMADEFLAKGKLIVYTKGIHEPRTDYLASDSGMFKQGKLAVLIDEYSASASEILAGALQDLDRATLIGRRSFGKGLVQEQFPFNDGSAINLTVARYYTPSGRSIQKSYKNGLERYHNDIAERMQKGELYTAQNNVNDSIFKHASAFRTAGGKKVYSGGGIMPDIFIPEDTVGNTYLVHVLSERQLFTGYVIDRLQPVLKKYNTEDYFINNFKVSDDNVDSFLVYSSKMIKEMDSNEIRRSRDTIRQLIKACAARFKWGADAYYRVLNENDEGIKKAIEAVRD